MAVPVQTPYVEYIANGISTQFSVPFQCLSKNTLIVSIDGVETLPQLWNFNSGEIIFITAPLNNSIVSIKRSTHLKREVSYNSFTNSMLPTVFNGDFDRIWHTLQEQSYKLGQYDFDYSYAVNTSNQANQKADLALEGLGTVLTETQPILRGGTGAKTAEDARTNLNVYSQAEVDALIATGGESNVVGVAGGGTGATTVAEACTNLGVMSSTEVENAINSATPQSTETALGVAKIATTAIAQAGLNDTDIITPLKLKNTVFGLGQNRKVVTKISGTTYTNTTGKPVGFEVIFKSTGSGTVIMDSNITVNLEIRQRSVMLVGNTDYRYSMFVIILPDESYSFNAVNVSSIEKVTEIS